MLRTARLLLLAHCSRPQQWRRRRLRAILSIPPGFQIRLSLSLRTRTSRMRTMLRFKRMRESKSLASQSEGKRDSLAIAPGRFVRSMTIIGDIRSDVTFYPVIRQTFKLTEGGDLVLHSFKFPRVSLPRDFGRVRCGPRTGVGKEKTSRNQMVEWRPRFWKFAERRDCSSIRMGRSPCTGKSRVSGIPRLRRLSGESSSGLLRICCSGPGDAVVPSSPGTGGWTRHQTVRKARKGSSFWTDHPVCASKGSFAIFS